MTVFPSSRRSKQPSSFNPRRCSLVGGVERREEFCFWWGGEEGKKEEFLIRRAIG